MGAKRGIDKLTFAASARRLRAQAYREQVAVGNMMTCGASGRCVESRSEDERNLLGT